MLNERQRGLLYEPRRYPRLSGALVFSILFVLVFGAIFALKLHSNAKAQEARERQEAAEAEWKTRLILNDARRMEEEAARQQRLKEAGEAGRKEAQDLLKAALEEEAKRKR